MLNEKFQREEKVFYNMEKEKDLMKRNFENYQKETISKLDQL
jgi:hypothetical protein